MRILAQTPVPVVPLALSGLWGSVFSAPRRRALGGAAAQPVGAHPHRRRCRRLPRSEATPELLRERVLALCSGR